MQESARLTGEAPRGEAQRPRDEGFLRIPPAESAFTMSSELILNFGGRLPFRNCSPDTRVSVYREGESESNVVVA